MALFSVLRKTAHPDTSGVKPKTCFNLCTPTLAMALVLTSCAQLEVNSLSADPKRPVFELHGATLAQLQTDATRLCPQGFDVLRQTQADVRQPGGLKAIGWWNEALSWLEDDRRQAQMVVSCKVP
jgi:hypothetical protein